MAQFINIEGTLINLDNVVRVIRHEDGQMIVEFNKSMTDVEQAGMWFQDTPAARAAYEWLKRTCVATFTDEAYGADSVQICPICGNKYESQTGLDYHLAHYHQAEGEAQS